MLGEVFLIEPDRDPVRHRRNPGDADFHRLGVGAGGAERKKGQAQQPDFCTHDLLPELAHTGRKARSGARLRLAAAIEETAMISCARRFPGATPGAGGGSAPWL